MRRPRSTVLSIFALSKTTQKYEELYALAVCPAPGGANRDGLTFLVEGIGSARSRDQCAFQDPTTQFLDGS
jgi:hypothetical protein